ncbi:MAG: FtsX-like permease family protein [Ekhidna sp.]|nr:FtsX-like permease family protein [Ekhidna sp.]
MNNSNHNPPRLATQFLRWFCAEDLIEEIQGDLEEAYRFRAKSIGTTRARIWYFSDVLKFFRPYSFEKYSRTKQYIPMVKNYFKIAVRNLIKRRGFTALNLLGLSIGMSTVLMLAIYLQHETSYDQMQPDSENIYRLVNNYRDQTYTCMFFNDYYGSDHETQMRLLQHVTNYEEVSVGCHFVPSHSSIGPNEDTYVSIGEKKFVMKDFLYTNTGQEFNEMFPQEFLQGSTSSAFSAFDRVVLTASAVEKFYGTDWDKLSLIGNTISLGDKLYQIGGVVRDVPGNVHFDFNMIVYQKSIPSWGAYTYLKINKEANIGNVISALNGEVDLVYPGYTEDVLSKGIESVPLHDIHFTGGMLYELKPIANNAYIITFGFAGIVILLIIWTNYTNLSIAIYASRQRELGVRKLLGARMKDVQLQILTEAVILTLVCFPIVWLLVYHGLPTFNDLMEVEMMREQLFQSRILMFLGFILVLTGLISGLYPAIFFSRKSLNNLFRGKLNSLGVSRFWNFRNTLLTAQFFMLVGLMSITLIIKNQMSYVQNKELGFDKEGVLFFPISGKENFHRLAAELRKLPEVLNIGNGMVPGAEMYNQLTYKMDGTEEVLSDGTHIYTSLGSMEVLGIKSDAFGILEEQDSVLLINQTAAAKLAKVKGIPVNELAGETLILEPEWENEQFGNGQHYTIAGIVEDFDYFSLKYPSQSLLIEVRSNPEWIYNVILKLESNDWLNTISFIESAYREIEPDRPFNFTFLDDHLEQLYKKEQNAGFLATFLTGVCIILAVMGLIGIVGFVTLSRQREMGIRKVFGASVYDILLTLNRSYIAMIALATALAVPVSLYFGSQWLNNFAYRIEPNYYHVFLAGVLTLFLVAVVVVIQSIRTAQINPSDSLRHE